MRSVWLKLLALSLLVPALAGADKADKEKPPKKDKGDPDKVEIWPPPAKTDEKPAPKPPPPEETPPLDEPPPRVEHKRHEEPEDHCEAPFEECREDCIVEHSNHDSLDPKGRKPLNKCLRRCQDAHDQCQERKSMGLDEARREKEVP